MILADSEGRMPPWCRHCGADLKSNPKSPTPVAAAEAPTKQPETLSAPGDLPVNGQGQSVSYIHACVPGLLGRNSLYRIYFTNTDLLFFRIGSGTISAGQVLPQSRFRVMPAGVGVQALTAYKDARKREMEQLRLTERISQLDGADEPTLRAYTGDAAFILGPGDVTWLRIDPPSAYIRYLYGVDHEGVLKFEHRAAGKMKLALPSWKDARRAIEELPKLFGNLARVNLSWGSGARRTAGYKMNRG
jgi:hypothetical protein